MCRCKRQVLKLSMKAMIENSSIRTRTWSAIVMPNPILTSWGQSSGIRQIPQGKAGGTSRNKNYMKDWRPVDIQGQSWKSGSQCPQGILTPSCREGRAEWPLSVFLESKQSFLWPPAGSTRIHFTHCFLAAQISYRPPSPFLIRTVVEQSHWPGLGLGTLFWS